MGIERHPWKQQGVVSLWRYTENVGNFPGWHLSADDAGVQSLLQLLGSLQSDSSAYRTVSISPPSKRLLQVPNNQRGRAKWVAPSKLQIRVSPGSDEWGFPPELDPAYLTVGSSHLPSLIGALEGIPRGEGDFSIGSDHNSNLRLWVWWWLDAA